MLDWNSLPDRTNADPEFRLAARHWTTTLRLDVGDESRALRIEDGAVTGIEATTPQAEAEVFISASTADWNELLADVPRPFYQDLTAAMIHHGVRMPADQVAYAAYYPALRRLIQLMSAARAEAE